MTFCLTLSNIDWSFTKDVTTIIGTFGALFIGMRGLNTWRRQLHGTSEYEVAKKTILLTIKVRDAMQAVRSPMLYLRKEEVEAGSSLEEEQRIYNERLQTLHERWAELRTLSIEARIIWGKGAEASFNSINELIGELQSQVWLHFWLKGAYAGPGATVDNNPERVAANNRIVYWTSDDDEFSQRIGVSVYQVEEYFQKRMRG